MPLLSKLGQLGKSFFAKGTAADATGGIIKDLYGSLSLRKKRIVGLGTTALGGIMGLNLIRGIMFRSPGHRDASMFGSQNPTLQAHNERRGSHLSGAALRDRDWRLFRG